MYYPFAIWYIGLSRGRARVRGGKFCWTARLVGLRVDVLMLASGPSREVKWERKTSHLARLGLPLAIVSREHT